LQLARTQLLDKEEMIQQYVERITELENKIHEMENQQSAATEQLAKREREDAKEAILQDPKLTPVHKKTMVMLYAQYTNPRKGLKKKIAEEATGANATESPESSEPTEPTDPNPGEEN